MKQRGASILGALRCFTSVAASATVPRVNLHEAIAAGSGLVLFLLIPLSASTFPTVVLVVLVLVLFLGNLRAALIVTAVIPLSMMFGFLGMAICGISANLMHPIAA